MTEAPTLARTAQHDQLLLEQEILSDDGSHAAGSAELRGCDGQVKQGEQEILHARDSVGQNSGATQWCPRPRFSDRIRNSRPTGDAGRLHPKLEVADMHVQQVGDTQPGNAVGIDGGPGL